MISQITKKLFIIYILLCLVIINSCTENDSDASPSIHKVMSFNIRYGTAKDGDNAWPKRKQLLFNVIKNQDPDILGVQEALDFQIEQLSAEMPYYKKSGAGRDDGRNAGEFSAILFDSTRYKLVREETFWFSDTPDSAGSLSWDAHFPRICSWAELLDKNGGQTLFVFNNHWDHQSQVSRNNSANMVVEKIATLNISDKPVIIMGDFNAGENNAAFKQLLENPVISIVDSYRYLHPDEENTGTFNGFEGLSNGEKIDAVLVSSAFQIINADILRTSKNGLYPSDHFPVTATLSVTKN